MAQHELDHWKSVQYLISQKTASHNTTFLLPDSAVARLRNLISSLSPNPPSKYRSTTYDAARHQNQILHTRAASTTTTSREHDPDIVTSPLQELIGYFPFILESLPSACSLRGRLFHNVEETGRPSVLPSTFALRTKSKYNTTSETLKELLRLGMHVWSQIALPIISRAFWSL